jgi:3-dehydroquinate dehydratase-1
MSGSVSIGSVKLGVLPAVVAIVERPTSAALLQGLKGRGASLVEVRVDRFDAAQEILPHYIQQIRHLTGLPLIGTIRDNPWTTPVRGQLFEQMLPLVDAVDIEIDTPLRDGVIAAAHRLGKTVIVSEHDYEHTPPQSQLHNLVHEAQRAGADIVKLATMAKGPEDVVRLLQLCHGSTLPMVAIAMGEQGTVSRVVGPLFGSLFTFGFIDSVVAPGQLSLDVLVAQLKMYYPSLTF